MIGSGASRPRQGMCRPFGPEKGPKARHNQCRGRQAVLKTRLMPKYPDANVYRLLFRNLIP